MIIGTGIDIIEVDRIKGARERWGDHFLSHVFCEEEIEYAKTYKNPDQNLAGRFAAKEAIFKAMGEEAPLRWKDIKILNDPTGRPYCVLKNGKFPHNIHLSISHTHNYAVANALITKKSACP